MSGIHPEADIKLRCLLFVDLCPVLGEERTWNRRLSTSVFDAVDGSTIGIAMCHGGIL